MAFVMMWLPQQLSVCGVNTGKHKPGSLKSLEGRQDYVKTIIFPDQTWLSLSWVLCRELFLFLSKSLYCQD